MNSSDVIATRSEPLVLSVHDAARALAVSDDVIYELIASGRLPCLQLGRRKVVPRRAIEMLLDEALRGFEPGALVQELRARPA